MIDLVAKEAARTVIGTSMGYFVGKWLGKKEHSARCAFLWDMEMEVSPKLLKKLIDQEVKEGCIKPEEADDRLAKVLDIRQKYGLFDGANTFAVVNSEQTVYHSSGAPESLSAPTALQKSSAVVSPPPVEKLAERERIEELAKQEVGPPSAIQNLEEDEEDPQKSQQDVSKSSENKPRKKFLGIF